MEEPPAMELMQSAAPGGPEGVAMSFFFFLSFLAFHFRRLAICQGCSENLKVSGFGLTSQP